MKKLLTILLVLCTLTSSAQMRGGSQFDPGAARTNLSNVDAAATPSMMSITLSDKVRAAWADILGDIYASGTAKVATGTAAAPAYSFASDPNTGMYSPAADSLAFVVAGVPVATISSAGITGIADSSVTNAKLAEPVAIEKGGTGATTAAAGLAALGGASLNGSSTVTFHASIYNNADGDIADLVAMANGFNPRRWGIKIAKATTDPATRVEYIYDAVGMTPAAMNFTSGEFEYGDWKPFCDAMNRPVMLDASGAVVEVLDPNDQTKKLDGTASGISSTTHSLNAMSEFKRLWLRTYEDATYQYIIFSNVQYDENYHANAFTDASGNIRDRMYYAMFEGSNVSSKLRSLATGAMMTNQTAATEISYAEANGAGWHINYKSQRDFITYLLALISKSTNSQAAFGQGNSSSGAYIAPGSLKNKGRFWGDDAADVAVKVFFIEHFWGNYWKRMSGLLYNGTADILIKATPPYSLTGVDYTNTDVTLTGASGQYITAGTLTDAGFLPTTAGGSDSTYFADTLYYATPAAGVFNVALVSGSRVNAGKCGSWACTLYSADVADSTIGASLSFLKYAAYGQ